MCTILSAQHTNVYIMAGRKKVTEAERFWEKVDRSGDCWEWTAYKIPSGYGWFRSGGSASTGGRLVVAHRWAYETLVGPIPDGLQLDHLCRNRGCVNPDHLEPVTIRENLRRGNGWSGRNARKTHCPRGHAYDEANTHVDKIGRRKCRTCDREKRRVTPAGGE